MLTLNYPNKMEYRKTGVNTMKKSTNKWQLSVILFSVCLLAFAVIYASQSYFSYQQVKASSDQCYDQGGFPKVVKSGWEVKLFECNFYEEN